MLLHSALLSRTRWQMAQSPACGPRQCGLSTAARNNLLLPALSVLNIQLFLYIFVFVLFSLCVMSLRIVRYQSAHQLTSAVSQCRAPCEWGECGEAAQFPAPATVSVLSLYRMHEELSRKSSTTSDTSTTLDTLASSRQVLQMMPHYRQ